MLSQSMKEAMALRCFWLHRFVVSLHRFLEVSPHRFVSHHIVSLRFVSRRVASLCFASLGFASLRLASSGIVASVLGIWYVHSYTYMYECMYR